jgi:hypothetical protein
MLGGPMARRSKAWLRRRRVAAACAACATVPGVSLLLAERPAAAGCNSNEMNYFVGYHISFPYNGWAVSKGTQNALYTVSKGQEVGCANGDEFAFETAHMDYAAGGLTFYEVGWTAIHSGTNGVNDYARWFEEAEVGGDIVSATPYITPTCSFPLDGSNKSTWKIVPTSTGGESTSWYGKVLCSDGRTLYTFPTVNVGESVMAPLGESGKFGTDTTEYEQETDLALRDGNGNWASWGDTTKDCDISVPWTNGFVVDHPSGGNYYSINAGGYNC